MAFNNNAYFDAALAGALAAINAGRYNTDSVQADYAAPVNVAVAIATEIDAKIPLDAGLTVARANALNQITAGVLTGRRFTSTTATDYATIATAIAAQFQQAILSLV